MLNILKKIAEDTKKLNILVKKNILENKATPTDWSFYGNLLQHLSYTYNSSSSHGSPGFFTPFNPSNGGVKQAAHTLNIVASRHLTQGVVSLFLGPPIALYSAVDLYCQGRGGLAKTKAMNCVTEPIVGLYFLGSFVVHLLKELTALITRSIATLVDLCKAPVTEDQSEEDPCEELRQF